MGLKPSQGELNLSILAKSGLTLNRKKCMFGAKEIKF